MTFYVIRHKASGQLMPQSKRRGYSHWNPSHPEHVNHVAWTGTPRLFVSEKSARKSIIGWFWHPNAEIRGYQTHDGEWDEDLNIKNDDRKQEDLEIIQAELTISNA